MTLPYLAVEIVIKDNGTGDSLTVPVLPTNGEIAYDDGAQKPISVDILDLGTVEIPAGVELDSMSWESFFPTYYDSYMSVGPGKLKKPLDYRNQFSTWKDEKTSVQVICAAAGINKTMYLKSFTWRLKGAEGDIYYNVTFTELKPLTPKKVKADGTPVSVGHSADDRPALPTAETTGKTYTVIAGDTLTLVGKKTTIPWQTIYDNNVAVIGPDPNKILPGQVLNL